MVIPGPVAETGKYKIVTVSILLIALPKLSACITKWSYKKRYNDSANDTYN